MKFYVLKTAWLDGCGNLDNLRIGLLSLGKYRLQILVQRISFGIRTTQPFW